MNPLSNLTPRQTQFVATIGPILGLVAGYFAAWWGVDQATALGVLTAGVGFVFACYNFWITRASAQITGVASMTEVNSIELDKGAELTESLMKSTPENVVAK